MSEGKRRICERTTVFAWLPVPLSEYRHPHWHMTGERAWLCKVERIDTFWRETYYRRMTGAAK